MKKKKKEIIYAFIDSQNLNLGVRSQDWRLDFKKFYIYLKDKLHVKKAFLFIGYMEEYRSLYQSLRKSGYEIIFKPAIRYGRKSIKGNVDADLVLHAAKIQYSKYNKAVVVTGDGDFYCLLEDMVKEKRLSRLVIPSRRSQSRLLRKFEKYKLFVNGLRTKVELVNKNGGRCFQHKN